MSHGSGGQHQMITLLGQQPIQNEEATQGQIKSISFIFIEPLIALKKLNGDN